jgi:hypothetical protein
MAAVAAAPEKLAAHKTLIQHSRGDAEVAVARRLFGARQSERGGGSESGAVRLNLKWALAVVGLTKLLVAWRGFRSGGRPVLSATFVLSVPLRQVAAVLVTLTKVCRDWLRRTHAAIPTGRP